MKNARQYPAPFHADKTATSARAPLTPPVWRPGPPAQALQAKSSGAARPMVQVPPAFRPFSPVAVQRDAAAATASRVPPVPPAFQPKRNMAQPAQRALVQRSAAKSVTIYSSAGRSHDADLLEQATNRAGYGEKKNGRKKYSGHGSRNNGAGVSGATKQANKEIMKIVHEIEQKQYDESRPKGNEYVMPKMPDLEKALKRGLELMVAMVDDIQSEKIKSEDQAVKQYTKVYKTYLTNRGYDGEVVEHCMKCWGEWMENYDDEGNLVVPDLV